MGKQDSDTLRLLQLSVTIIFLSNKYMAMALIYRNIEPITAYTSIYNLVTSLEFEKIMQNNGLLLFFMLIVIPCTNIGLEVFPLILTKNIYIYLYDLGYP
jgi:hypothetical protein